MMEAPQTEAELVAFAFEALSSSLPEGWSVTTTLNPQMPNGRGRMDALAEIAVDEKPVVTFVIEAKTLFRPRDVDYALNQLTQWSGQSGARPMLVARYLSPSARQRIIDLGGAYLDATGNARVLVQDPPLFLMLNGAEADPWRRPGRPRATLNGVPAARAVRALVDFAPPYSVPELMELASTSSGATYRVVKFLDGEALIEREDGKIVEVRWADLLRRWSKDYGFRRAESVKAYLDPRGPEATLERLVETDGDKYVITGSFAAQLNAPYAPPRLLALYVRDPRLPDELGLRPVEASNNVLVAYNEDPFALERPRRVDGRTYAAVSQVVVDLMNLPGRSPAEAEALLEWMERNDDWRR